jgi:hypothetical protein
MSALELNDATRLVFFFLATASIISSLLIKEKGSLQKGLKVFRVNIIIIGVSLILLSFCLHYPSIESSHPSNVQVAQEVLVRLGRCEQVLMNITIVIKWIVFVLVFWFFSLLYALSKSKMDS